MREVSIAGKKIGPGHPPYVIAEIGTNHNRSIETAKRMIAEISESGCDCVKFQIYEPDEIVSQAIRASDYGLDTVYGDISAQEMFEQYLKTPKEWFPQLKQLCHDHGMACGVTLHGSDGIEWARTIGFDFIKVASMDHTNLPLLRELVLRMDVPILVSFGLAELEDIQAAIAVFDQYEFGHGFFHCCAIYPPEAHEVRLGNISFLIEGTNVPIGFSDHTMGAEMALQARALGAVVFEKHVTLSRQSKGPDHPFAMETSEFKEYISALRNASAIARDDADVEFLLISPRESEKRADYLKSIIVKHDLPVGHVVKEEDVYLARPGTGMPPSRLEWAIGRKLIKSTSAHQPLQVADFESE